MNFSLFVAKKIRNTEQTSFSKTVTYVGMGTIALGTAIVIISFAILFGFKQAIVQKITGFSGNYKISRVSEDHSLTPQFLQVPKAWEEQVLAMNGVDYLHKTVQSPGILVGEKTLSGMVVKGTDSKEFLEKELNPHLIEGKLGLLGKQEVYLSKSIAEKCQVKAGEHLILYFLSAANRPRKVLVKGIYETGLEEIDQYTVFGNLAWVKELTQVPENLHSSVEVHLKEGAADLSKVIEKTLPIELRLDTIEEIDPAIFDWLVMLDRNIVILITLLLFVAGFNLIATLWVLIMERIPMIGLLKSIGASNRQIRRIFWWNGMFILSWGILFANLIALAFCYLQDQYQLIPLDASTYYMHAVPIYWSGQAWLLTNLGTIILVAIFLSIPTLYIQKISPLEAIRFRD